ncbi:high-affinity iron permease, partial [Blyttiomyces sp. JEL0837]
MIGFSLPVFFATFREATEASIVVSVLMSFVHGAFVDQPEMRKKLNRQIWMGTGIGVGISLAIGAAFLTVFFKYANNV